MPTSPTQRAERFLAQEEAWARRALRRSSLAWWTASLSGRSQDYQRMEAAERAINRHYARTAPFERISRLTGTTPLDKLTRRRLERLRLTYHAKQAPLDLLDRVTAAEAAIQETYSTFRGEFAGRQVTDNELEDILRTTTDSRQAQAVWEARKQIGGVVADDLRALAHMRNAAARAIGFETFWHQQLVLDELEPEGLMRTLEAAAVATDAPFKAMKQDLDRLLARRFGLTSPAELRPWHYGA
jgi:peptidyl-dipeptidase A